MFSRGLAALAFTLVLALPALAMEQDAGQGPPPHAQGPPAHAGGDPGPPQSAAAPPDAGAQPGPPPGQRPEEPPVDAGARPDSADPGTGQAPPDHARPHASAASTPDEPATAGEPEQSPSPPARIHTRSAGTPDLSGAPAEDTAASDRRPADRPAVEPAPGRRGELVLPPQEAGVPAAVTFRRAVDRAGRERASEPAELAGAASSGAPRTPETPAAEPPRSEPVPPAQPFPARVVPRQVRQIVEVVPGEIWAALGALALLALVLAASSWVTALRARRLRRQREALRQEVGLLQSALLPAVPDDVPVSVAYRPVDGATAGGDFYEAFALGDGRTAMILGGITGRGRDALARTTFIRYTLRAYLEAGLEPREVVKVGSEALEGHLAGGYATATVAVHEPESGRFTYASAGHSPPAVVGPGDPFEAITACPAPPMGVGEPTGFRQTTFTLTAGSRACLYTDGVVDARAGGRLLGVGELERSLARLPAGAGAEELLDSLAEAADEITSDMAVCLVGAPAGVPAAGPRVEELEVDEREVGDSLEHFLRACGIPLSEVPNVLRQAGEAARREGSATVRVRLGDFRPGVDVVPGNLVRLDERRRAARL